MFIALGVSKELPLWLVIAVVTRDILIVLGRDDLLGDRTSRCRSSRSPSARPTRTAQIVLAATVLADEAFGLGSAACASPWCGSRERLTLAFAGGVSPRLASPYDRLRVLRPVTAANLTESRARVPCGESPPRGWIRRGDRQDARRTTVLFWLTAALVLAARRRCCSSDVLLPFVAAIVIAYFLNPMADALERLGLPRGSAATLMVLLAGAIVTAGRDLVLGAADRGAGAPARARRCRRSSSASRSRSRPWARERLGPIASRRSKVALDKGIDGLSQNWGGLGGWCRC